MMKLCHNTMALMAILFLGAYGLEDVGFVWDFKHLENKNLVYVD